MKPAKLFYHFIARAHMKMIGIGKLYLSPNLMKIHGGHCAFDCTDGSYIHKYRGLYCAVDRMKLCPFCTPLCFQQLIFYHSSASSFCGNILTVFQYNLYCIKSKVYSQRKSCGLRWNRSCHSHSPSCICKIKSDRFYLFSRILPLFTLTNCESYTLSF